ncbi:PadR family transcriptional regulator [Roseivirga sp.]|uniref:PadR family transcriptional regulator n=1 Tax=Roseivirga sp. TaxID=1964215 RepID=UPI003B8C012C
MKGSHLGEFQELALLTILVLGDDAYGVSIKKEINSNRSTAISRGALHTALTRLEEKGYLKSRQGEANEARGGRPKRYYEVSNKGKSALHELRDMRDSLWNRIPSSQLAFKNV